MLDSGFKAVIVEVMTDLRKELRQSQAAQGHRLTGKLEDSIDFEIEESPGEIVAKMYMENYGVFVEFGVSAGNIPYTPGNRGRGGTSQYIQALINFFELRGLSGREAVGAAFGTATIHAREGMPTRRSARFSSTGERTGFVKTAIENQTKSISDKIEKQFGVRIEFLFADNFKGYENLIVQ